MNRDAPPPSDRPEHNRTGLDYRRPLPRPKVRGGVIDWHTHLLARRHAADWFAAADHYGVDRFLTMTPLEEALGLQRQWGHRLHFIAIPRWQTPCFDDWLRRIEAFHNLGSRVVKIHLAPRTMAERNWRLDQPGFRRVIDEARARGMVLMSHIGDPETWYRTKYADAARFGVRDDHYRQWAGAMEYAGDHPWVGAHLGGNPEDPARLAALLERFPRLMLDLSATKWMVREISARRDALREFVLRYQDRLLWGTDQVSGDNRGFDFLASRFWCHRKLWETAWEGPSPIHDPDLPEDQQPTLRGLALPDGVLQKIYRDNAVSVLASVGAAAALAA